VADAEMAGWEARIEQLRLEATLGKMGMADEVSSLLARLKSAYDAARGELDEIPDLVEGELDEIPYLVEDASDDLPGRLRPAIDKIAQAYREARLHLN
jgi:hypothetical protein